MLSISKNTIRFEDGALVLRFGWGRTYYKIVVPDLD